MALSECLQNSGLDYNRLQSGVPYSLNSADQNAPRHSWVDPTHIHSAMSMSRGSNGDIQSFNDNDSINSSPGVQRRTLGADYNFDAMKRALGEPTEAAKRERMESQRQITKTFRNANFDELMRRTEPKHDLQARLSELFNSLAVERQIMGQKDQLETVQPNKTVYEKSFPELFFY